MEMAMYLLTGTTVSEKSGLMILIHLVVHGV